MNNLVIITVQKIKKWFYNNIYYNYNNFNNNKNNKQNNKNCKWINTHSWQNNIPN